jgi:hypothetical protein
VNVLLNKTLEMVLTHCKPVLLKTGLSSADERTANTYNSEKFEAGI